MARHQVGACIGFSGNQPCCLGTAATLHHRPTPPPPPSQIPPPPPPRHVFGGPEPDGHMCVNRHKCAACCGEKKGKVVKGQDETVVKNADLHNAKQGGLISKALHRGSAQGNAWSPEEQRAFQAQVGTSTFNLATACSTLHSLHVRQSISKGIRDSQDETPPPFVDLMDVSYDMLQALQQFLLQASQAALICSAEDQCTGLIQFEPMMQESFIGKMPKQTIGPQDTIEHYQCFLAGMCFWGSAQLCQLLLSVCCTLAGQSC